ncbi:S8 family serine peptidase [Yinghuangia seranimata]|uniref:S8 family serine peptidase n=1 Tax=Yinghuangia seranimata TaxID=408067 RepID=UPI00248D352A|nr:S8 family serine peptidase [Yinghuangia seranimata]MDI2132473.1 S8 family serine peptidase [Yinghuangia seranimata]
MVSKFGRVGRPLNAAAAVATTVAVVLGPVSVAQADTPRQEQWYLDTWNIADAWKISQGDGVSVAVVDSGVDANTEDLQGQVLPGPLGSGDDAQDQHGTHMASHIAGTGKSQSGQGPVGVAPKTKIIPVKVAGSASKLALTADIAAAIKAAADTDAKIINVSMGSQGAPDKTEADAVKYAQSKGKLVVASAGNRAESLGPGATYPAAFPGVLGVGGYDHTGAVWSGSVTGNWVALAAPGVDQISACTGPGGQVGYCKTTGTSAASALVSGIAALVWSAHPDWTANQVIKRLIDTANKPPGQVPNDQQGYGNVSPRKALQSTDPPGPADVNPLVGVRGDKPAAAPSSAPSAAASGAAPPPGSAVPSAPHATSPSNGVKEDSSDGGGSNVGLIAGIAGGAVVVVALVIWLVVRRRNNGNQPPPPPGSGPPPAYQQQQPTTPFPQSAYPQQPPWPGAQPPQPPPGPPYQGGGQGPYAR